MPLTRREKIGLCVGIPVLLTGGGGVTYLAQNIFGNQYDAGLRYGDKLCVKDVKEVSYGPGNDGKVREGTRKGIYLQINAFHDRNQDGVKQESEASHVVKVVKARFETKNDIENAGENLRGLKKELEAEGHFTILPHPPELGMCLVAKDSQGNLIVPPESIQFYRNRELINEYESAIATLRDSEVYLNEEIKKAKKELNVYKSTASTELAEETSKKKQEIAELTGELNEAMEECDRLKQELRDYMGRNPDFDRDMTEIQRAGEKRDSWKEKLDRQKKALDAVGG